MMRVWRSIYEQPLSSILISTRRTEDTQVRKWSSSGDRKSVVMLFLVMGCSEHAIYPA